MLSKGDNDAVQLKDSDEKKKTGTNTGVIIISVLLISGVILWWSQKR